MKHQFLPSLTDEERQALRDAALTSVVIIEVEPGWTVPVNLEENEAYWGKVRQTERWQRWYLREPRPAGRTGWALRALEANRKWRRHNARRRQNDERQRLGLTWAEYRARKADR